MDMNLEIVKNYAEEIGADVLFDRAKGWYVLYGQKMNRVYFSTKKSIGEQPQLGELIKYYYLSINNKFTAERDTQMDEEFKAIISKIPNDILDELKVLSKNYESRFIEYFDIDPYY